MPVPMPLPPAPYIAPDLRLIAANGHAQLTFVVDKATGRVVARNLSHSIWLTPENAPLEVNTRREPDGTRTATQVFHADGDRGTGMPSEVAGQREQAVGAYGGPRGALLGRLRDFTRWTIRDADGEAVAGWYAPQCAGDSYGGIARLDRPGTSDDPTYPSTWEGCGRSSYILGRVVGLDRGWAMHIGSLQPTLRKLTPGAYALTATVNPKRHLAETNYANDSATVKLKVRVVMVSRPTSGGQSCFGMPCLTDPIPPAASGKGRAIDSSKSLGRQLPPGTTKVFTARVPRGARVHMHADGSVQAHLSTTPVVREEAWIGRELDALERRTARIAARDDRRGLKAGVPTPAPIDVDLPDLRSAPSFGIETASQMLGGTRHDYLNFGALTWNAGPGRLEVEAFRESGTTLSAYQTFFRDGERTARQSRGTLIWHAAPGHNHFHFQAFAQYRLQRMDGSDVRVSGKNSWCIVDTNVVDTTLPGAASLNQGGFAGLTGGCGMDPGSLWARLSMSVGAGDLYSQLLAGQAFDVTNLANGSYRIIIEANPDALIAEASYSNNISRRVIRLSGPKGDRRVTVLPTPTVDDPDASGKFGG